MVLGESWFAPDFRSVTCVYLGLIDVKNWVFWAGIFLPKSSGHFKLNSEFFFNFDGGLKTVRARIPTVKLKNPGKLFDFAWDFAKSQSLPLLDSLGQKL